MTGEPQRKAHVRRSDRGQGLFANATLRPGDAILELRGTVVPAPSRWSIQIARDRHIEPRVREDGTVDPDAEWRFLNHSCRPSTVIDTVDLTVRAATPLEPGDELTFDYLTTELLMAEPFACACGAEGCYGVVSGFVDLPPERRAELLSRAAPHVREAAEGLQVATPGSVGGELRR